MWKNTSIFHCVKQLKIKGDLKMSMENDFEKYLEELTQEIIDAFTVEPDRSPSMS